MTLGTRLSSAPIPKAEFPNPAPSWTAVSFAANISNYDGTNFPCGYTKDNYSVVHLRGIAKTSTTTGTQTLFTLPSGYQPAQTDWFMVIGSTAAKGEQCSKLTIDTSGVVSMTWYSTVAANDAVFIGGVTFRV